MKYFLPKSYKKLLVAKWLILIIISQILLKCLLFIYTLIWLKYEAAAFGVLVLTLTLFIFNIILFKKQRVGTFYILDKNNIRVRKSYFFTLFYNEVVCKTENVLSYSISQSIISKQLSLHKVVLYCGGDRLKFYIEKDNINAVLDFIECAIKGGEGNE